VTKLRIVTPQEAQPAEAESVRCHHCWAWHYSPLIDKAVEVGQCMLCGALCADLREGTLATESEHGVSTCVAMAAHVAQVQWLARALTEQRTRGATEPARIAAAERAAVTNALLWARNVSEEEVFDCWLAIHNGQVSPVTLTEIENGAPL
jgi:hypothetical protein